MAGLIVERKVEQRVVCSNGVSVQVLSVRGRAVRLRFEAPPGVTVLREELLAGACSAEQDSASAPGKG